MSQNLFELIDCWSFAANFDGRFENLRELLLVLFDDFNALE